MSPTYQTDLSLKKVVSIIYLFLCVYVVDGDLENGVSSDFFTCESRFIYSQHCLWD